MTDMSSSSATKIMCYVSMSNTKGRNKQLRIFLVGCGTRGCRTIDGALMMGDGPFTVFAPAAFEEELLATLGVSLSSDLVAEKELLTSVLLLYHVVVPAMSDSVVDSFHRPDVEFRWERRYQWYRCSYGAIDYYPSEWSRRCCYCCWCHCIQWSCSCEDWQGPATSYRWYCPSSKRQWAFSVACSLGGAADLDKALMGPFTVFAPTDEAVWSVAGSIGIDAWWVVGGQYSFAYGCIEVSPNHLRLDSLGDGVPTALAGIELPVLYTSGGSVRRPTEWRRQGNQCRCIEWNCSCHWWGPTTTHVEMYVCRILDVLGVRLERKTER